MKKLYSLLPILFVALVCYANPQAGNKNSYNLDMETAGSSGMPEGWIARTPKDTTISADSLQKLIHADKEVKQHGSSSILLDLSNTAGWAVAKTVIRKSFEGQKIKLTGYLKTEDVKSGGGLWFRIDGVNGPIEFDNMAKRAVSGTTDWTEYTIELNYDGKNAKSIVAGAQIMGTGKLWVDNLHITIDGVDISQAALYDGKVNYNLDVEVLNATGQPAGWGLGNVRSATAPTDSSRYAYRLDEQTKQHGKYSLLIDWTRGYSDWTATNYVIRKTFEGKSIRLTGYLKTEDITQGAGLWMRIDGDGKTLAFDNMQSRSVKGTTDWKEYSIDLEYDASEAKTIVVGGIIVGKGKLWMDNLQISIDGKDIAEAKEYSRTIEFKAEADTQFANASGVSVINSDASTLGTLTNLGMLWGFMKYYHANVCKGDFNMDAELFRILPEVLAAKNKNDANAVLTRWVAGFGQPDICKSCDTFRMTDEIKLAPDYGYLFEKGNLPEKLVAQLTYIKQNRSPSGKSYYIKMEDNIGNPKFLHENSFSANSYPDAGVRLLSLYRYWNMVQYFFPDRHLIGEDWNKVLSEFIPEFCNAKDTMAYQLACLKLIARIHDTHANVWGSSSDQLSKAKGKMITPFAAKFIEEQLVVMDYYSDANGIKDIVKRGDIIEKINKVPVAELVRKYLPLTPASNYETQLRDMPGFRGFLLRTNEPTMQVTISRGGKTLVETIQTVPVGWDMAKVDAGSRPDSSYKMLAGNIGYIYPGKLKAADLDKIKELFADTKGIVIDMRCYPSDFMTFTYAQWLKPKSSPFVKFTGGSTEMPGKIEYSEPQSNGGGANRHYMGKLVIIVNAETQSSAEYQTMALSTTPGAKVIGSTTAGADGNVSQIMLPGGISTMFSGLGVLYPDGTETQRTGVRIDKVMKPTIKATIEGRDELLDEAIRMMN